MHVSSLTGNPPFESRIGNLEIAVSMVSLTSVPGDESAFGVGAAAIGAGSFGLGLSAPPMFASGLVVGGVLLMPMGAYFYHLEKSTWNAIHDALTAAAMTSWIGDALQRTLAGTPLATEDAHPSSIAVIIDGFGLMSGAANFQHCLVLTGELLLRDGSQEPYREKLRITETEPSADAPPPQCGSIESFVADDARLVRDSLREYAEVVAVMTRDRLLRRIAP